MRFVISLSLLCGFLGAIPALYHALRAAPEPDAERDVLYTLTACYFAIFGAILGATHAIQSAYMHAYTMRNQSKPSEPVGLPPGFLSDMFSMWSPPMGHARRDWRHRMQHRRRQALVALMYIAILGFLIALTYFLSGS